MKYIHLDFEKSELMFSIKKEDNIISMHTGNTLEKKEICLTTDKKIHENVINKYKKKEINSIDKNLKKLKKWNIVESSFSIINNKYSHYFTLEEIERLNIKNLIIGDVNISPYTYNEQFINNALSIEAKANLTESQFEKIKKMNEKGGSYEVIRRGISEKIYKMKLGRPLWSKDSNNVIKYGFCLTEEKYFFNIKDPFAESFVRVDNISYLLAKQEVVLSNLLSTLAKKSFITKEELYNIKNIQNKEINDKLIYLSRVKDIDNYR